MCVVIQRHYGDWSPSIKVHHQLFQNRTIHSFIDGFRVFATNLSINVLNPGEVIYELVTLQSNLGNKYILDEPPLISSDTVTTMSVLLSLAVEGHKVENSSLNTGNVREVRR